MVYRKKQKPDLTYAPGMNRGAEEAGKTTGDGHEMPEYLLVGDNETNSKIEKVVADAAEKQGDNDAGERQKEDLSVAKAQVAKGPVDEKMNKVINAQVVAAEHVAEVPKEGTASLKRGPYQKHSIPIGVFEQKMSELEQRVVNAEKWVQNYNDKKAMKNTIRTEIARLGLKEKVDVQQIKTETVADKQQASKQQEAAPTYAKNPMAAPSNYASMLGGRRAFR